MPKKALVILECFIPLLTLLINQCLLEGVFPCSFKTAYVRPLLIKNNLDKDLMNNYRLVSNISFVSKVLESVVLSQLWSHLELHNIIPKFQFAYQKFHFTEIALCRINNDFVGIVCSGCSSILI